MFIRKAGISTVAIWALFIMLLACASAQAGDTRSQTEITASDIQEDEQQYIVSEQYNGQSSFKCNDLNLKFPSYFPFGASRVKGSNTFVGYNVRNCAADNYAVTLGIGQDCHGENICYLGGFFVDKESKTYSSQVLRSALERSLKHVSLDGGIDAYFIPAECNAYCNPAQLVWFSYGMVFIIESKISGDSSRVLDEFVKSANSYLFQVR